MPARRNSSDFYDAKDKKPAATNGGAPGRIIVSRSPVLGDNVTVAVTLDGRTTSLVRSRVLDEVVSPGPHVLRASPNYSAEHWQTTIDVQPGQTYKFIARYTVNRLTLDRVK